MSDELTALETIIEDLRKYVEWLEDAYMGELDRQGALAMTPNDMRSGLREDHGVSEVWSEDSE